MTLDQIPVPDRGAVRPAPVGTDPAPEPGAGPRGRSTLRSIPWYGLARRPVVVVPVVAVVGAAVWFFAFRSGGSPSAAATTTTKQLVTATRGALADAVSAEGTVAAAQTDNLSFSSAGTVTAVNVKAGDTVTAGEVLATMDSASLQSAVASAASTLAKAQATLADDEAAGASSDQLAADRTSVTTATDSLARAWQGLAGASLVATFDGTVASVNLTVGEQLSSSGSGATTPTGSSTGQSSSTLGNGSSNGLGANSNSNGSSSSSAQIQVVSKGSYTVSLPVSSSDVDSIKVGDAVTLTVTTATGGRFGGFGGFGGGGFRFFNGGAAPGGNGASGANGANGNGNATNGSNGAAANTGATATGTVTAVGKVATASSGVAQYPVTVGFSTDNAQFSIGSTVTGAIRTVVADDVLQVPVRAVTTDGNGRSTVTVALDGK
ncbi:MAG TPA: biotin/lipoyl-binding protein, partial [Acidimicrobiia bacterium]|nr:biotin/lipoyl-binding protein [Acidimicrobiia bacterium]